MDEPNGGTNGETETQTPETTATDEARALQTQTKALRELLERMRTVANDQGFWANEIEAIIGK